MSVAIIGHGAFTPLGLTSLQTAFLLRTGMPGFTPSGLADTLGDPITFGLLQTLDPRLLGVERAIEIVNPALSEACVPLRPHADSLRLGIVLAVDEWLAVPLTRGEQPPVTELVRAVEARAREMFPRAKVTPCTRGAAGPAFMVPDAIAALTRGEIDVLLFGGVHTDYDPGRLRVLEARGRLFTTSNLDAMIPGEASAFVALARADVARRAGCEVYARIEGFGGGMESATPDNDHSAFEAKGLTTALRALEKPLEGRTAGWMLGDLTFEMWRLNEWQAAITRSRKIWGDPYHADLPAQRMGNLGAAALPVLAAVATEGFRRGHAPSPIAIGFAGSDSGERASMIVASP
ncbi:MAG: beta-ketoacyl synthase N-terminal-like domain-containing protein [Polyangiales bacterium]